MDEPTTSHSNRRSQQSAIKNKLSGLRSAGTAFTIAMVLMLALTGMAAPAAAQDGSADEVATSDSDVCDNSIMQTINGAISFFTLAGPSVGILNAAWNMSKAGFSNQSNDKKEAKQNIKSSLIYGFGTGALTGIVGLFTAWGPFAVCGGAV
jgi:ABC-type Fe3+ transport system permease subunit